jgi:predicted phosphodiesterase
MNRFLVDIICFGHIHISRLWESRDGMLAMNAGKSTDPINYRGKNCLSYREITLNGSVSEG